MLRLANSVYFVGLAVWVGGLAVLAVFVAPVLFRNAPSRRAAGNLFSSVLRAFSYLETVCAILVACGGTAVLLGSETVGSLEAARFALLVVVMLIFFSYTFWIHPAMWEIQKKCGDLEREPEDDEQRAARNRFDALHRWSERLVGANIFLGFTLLVFSASLDPPWLHPAIGR